MSASIADRPPWRLSPFHVAAVRAAFERRPERRELFLFYGGLTVPAADCEPPVRRRHRRGSSYPLRIRRSDFEKYYPAD